MTPGTYARRNKKRFRKKAPEQTPDLMATGSGGSTTAMMRRMTSPIDISFALVRIAMIALLRKCSWTEAQKSL